MLFASLCLAYMTKQFLLHKVIITVQQWSLKSVNIIKKTQRWRLFMVVYGLLCFSS